MTKLPSMPFFPADFFADTERVSPDAAKAYLFLLGHAWLQGGKLPNEDKILGRLSRCGPKLWRSIKADVLSFWELGEDGYFRNSRLTRELVWVSQRIAKNEIAGRLGNVEKNRKRLNLHNTSHANGYANRTQMGTHPDPNPNKEDSFNWFGKERGNGGLANTETDLGVYVKQHTPAGEAWAAWSRINRQKSQVWDAKGGWWFPTEWPPKDCK